MKEMQLEHAVTNQGSAGECKAKVLQRLKRKRQHALVKKVILEKARKKDLSDLKQHGKSVKEIFSSIVPGVQQKSKRKAGSAKPASKKKGRGNQNEGKAGRVEARCSHVQVDEGQGW